MKIFSHSMFILPALIITAITAAAVSANKVESNFAYCSIAINDTLPGNKIITFQIFKADQNTFGYDIFSNGQKVIHQPTIPSLPGNKGFSNKEDAKKVALLVIEKIRKGIMPPTLTLQELRSLGVIH